MDSIAAQIRQLIHSAMPGMDSTVKGLPDVALIAAPAALLVVIVLLLMIMAMAGGDKKKKAARAERGQRAIDDGVEPPSRVVRPEPPRPALQSAPAPDKRTDTLITALVKARQPNAEPQSSDERVAMEGAAARVLKASPAGAKALMSNMTAGFEKLAEEANELTNAAKPGAAQAWRDLGIVAEGIDDPASLQALENAFQLDASDFWGDIFLARARCQAGKPSDGLIAAQAAAAHAKGPRDKAVAWAEVGDACMQANRPNDARDAYQAAIDVLRTLARSGERRAQRDLSIGLNKLGDLERAVNETPRACALFREDLLITRHLAKTDPSSDEAQRDLLISVTKLAEASGEHVYWVEARDLAEKLARGGKLTGSDGALLDVLRKQAAATAPASPA